MMIFCTRVGKIEWLDEIEEWKMMQVTFALLVDILDVSC